MDEKQTPPNNKESTDSISTDSVQPASEAEGSTKRGISKQTMIGIVAVLALGVIGAAAMLLPGDDSGDSVTTPVVSQKVEDDSVQTQAAAITLIEGAVQYSRDGSTWMDAAGGETIEGQDYVRTLSDGRAVVLLDDGSAIRLDADSEIQLSVSDTNSVDVMLMNGQVYSRVVESESRTFAVVTNNERFEAQGTAYKTSTDDKIDRVEVYESKVKIDSDGTEVDEGNAYDTETKEKTGLDLEQLKNDEFAQWNKQKDSENDSFKDKLGVLDLPVEESKEDKPVETTPVTSPTASISLSGETVDNGVKLTWVMKDGASSADGFKIVRDKHDTTPSYKENTSVYVGGGSKTSYVVDVDDGNSYHFRVCIYRSYNSTCDTYSNSVYVAAPFSPPEAVEHGDVTLSISGNTINWVIAGTAPHGYKVVLNETGSPAYPANSVQYVGSGSSSTSLPDKPAGTYYVKVCKYTADSAIDGGCTDYSNEVEYVVSS